MNGGHSAQGVSCYTPSAGQTLELRLETSSETTSPSSSTTSATPTHTPSASPSTSATPTATATPTPAITATPTVSVTPYALSPTAGAQPSTGLVGSAIHQGVDLAAGAKDSSNQNSAGSLTGLFTGSNALGAWLALGVLALLGGAWAFGRGSQKPV